ncbi:hypothetical protein MTO96_017757, partial [Rhipicephalus appendiculatus]
ASAGIGESTAKHFASLGCWLSLTGRNTANLDRVAEACCALGLPQDKVLVVSGDVSVAADVAAVVQRTVKHFGKIDILVNNAGISHLGSIESASLEDFKRVWEVNFCGALCMMKNAMPYLRQTKGSVVNVSSIAALTPIPYAVPYAVTKAALEHLSKCAALENAPYGVRVNTISPGVIKTLMGRPPGVSAEAFMTDLEKRASVMHALGRVGTAEEVAHCIAFLASDDAAFVTGITMPMDGGLATFVQRLGRSPSGECPEVLVVPGDVTVQDDVTDVVQKTVKHFGKIDILDVPHFCSCITSVKRAASHECAMVRVHYYLCQQPEKISLQCVNSAGIPVLGSIESTSMEDFRRSWDVNFNGPLRMMKSAMPYLRETKGNIVNVSSVSAMTAVQRTVPYTIPKAALDHLTRCAALENAPYGVRANTINPAAVKTLMMMRPGFTVEEHMERLDRVVGPMHPLNRVATPEEVARCIAFLASDDAGFITGISVPIDGGVLLTSTVSGAGPAKGDQKAA